MTNIVRSSSIHQNPAIRVEDLSKVYKVNGPHERYRTLRDKLADVFARRPRFAEANDAADLQVWALKGVEFDVQPGEVVGIIGRNGAGKSTLLKILSRITEPSSGRIEICGRVGSLLEVGAGFHLELTGRENIYLNSAILGMKKAEVTRKLDAIVAFAELERFIDTPVKHYSSGMYMRLAFSVAAHLETEILFVDEVLAVGDAAFQKKCLGKMSDVAREGRTVLFVSHNMNAVRGLCQRAIWLSEGKTVADGDVYDVIQEYMATLSETGFHHENKNYEFVIEDVALRNDSGERTLYFKPGEDLIVDIAYDASNPIKEPYVYLMVKSMHGSCFSANMYVDGHQPESLYGKGVLSCRFKSIPLLPQSYTIQMAIRTSEGKDSIVPPQEVGSFYVVCDLEDYGMNGKLVHGLIDKTFPVLIPYEWTMPDGSTASASLSLPEGVDSHSLMVK